MSNLIEIASRVTALPWRMSRIPLPQPSVAAKVLARIGELPELAGEPRRQPLVDPLTHRELEVLRALADGLSNREAADRLYLSEGTVKNHVTSVLAKLGVRDRTQAALRARELGLL